VAVLVFHSLVSLWEYLLPAVRVFLIFRLVVEQLVEKLVYLDDLTLLISFIWKKKSVYLLVHFFHACCLLDGIN